MIAVLFLACSETDRVGSTEEKHISYEDSLYGIYVSLPAPDDVFMDIDTLISDSLKCLIKEYLGEKQFLKMSFSLRDSAIEDVYVFGKDSILNNLMQQELQGHNPHYEFIDDYNYCDFGFLLDKDKLTLMPR